MATELKYDEFLRSISISKESSYTMLLGAGCSISSDIQSANDCIWEWKKIIYKSNNPSVQEWVENYKNPRTQETIQKWLDNQGSYIEKNSEDEYSFYAKKCFPIEENRRQYFQKICTNKSPSMGYKSIPFLVKQGMLDSIWTTNFDDLVSATCINGGVQGIDISLDTVNRINQRTQARNELPIIKLHGDFKYGDLKNTTDELQNQDDVLRSKMIEYLSDKNLIVIGYSGRDNSLMESLKKAYLKPGAGMLRGMLSLTDANDNTRDEAAVISELEADEGNSDARFQLGIKQALRGDFETGVKTLMDLMQRDREYGDDGARKTLVSVFDAMGDDPRVGPMRRQMFNLLH